MKPRMDETQALAAESDKADLGSKNKRQALDRALRTVGTEAHIDTPLDEMGGRGRIRRVFC